MTTRSRRQTGDLDRRIEIDLVDAIEVRLIGRAPRHEVTLVALDRGVPRAVRGHVLRVRADARRRRRAVAVRVLRRRVLAAAAVAAVARLRRADLDPAV